MAVHIRQQNDQGAYAAFTELIPFCRKLTSDLRSVSGDQHLFVFHSPEEAREVAARNHLLPPDDILRINQEKERKDRVGHYGFSNVEIMEGPVGYIDIDWFSASDKACDKVDSVMRIVAGAEAIIIDLRDNGGGGGRSLPWLMSYFFGPQPVPFTGIYYRETNDIEASWSFTELPGKRLPGVELYILTSARTFSAAEDFSYSLQALKRAVIVGERTKGGAHPVEVIIIKGDILTQVAIGNSVSPITGSNWEGTGVIPDIETASESALDVAYARALDALLSRAIDAERIDELESINARLNSKDQ
jgi:C-terminal processing protease CtpA/Prc